MKLTRLTNDIITDNLERFLFWELLNLYVRVYDYALTSTSYDWRRMKNTIKKKNSFYRVHVAHRTLIYTCLRNTSITVKWIDIRCVPNSRVNHESFQSSRYLLLCSCAIDEWKSDRFFQTAQIRLIIRNLFFHIVIRNREKYKPKSFSGLTIISVWV